MKLKELYQIAKAELEEMTSMEDADFRLEQVEYNEKEEVWEIVVSYLVENTSKHTSPLAVLSSAYSRLYKKLKIDNNKNVKGFYIFDK